MTLIWAVIGVSMLLAMLAGIVMSWQILVRRDVCAALQRCNAQRQKLKALLVRQEAELRELRAGLRAERTHVEQLQRRLKLLCSTPDLYPYPTSG